MSKKFNKENHEKNDKEAKRRFKSWFDKKYSISKVYDYVDEGNQDKFKYDAKIKERKTGKEVLIELEIRSKDDFEKILKQKFPTLHIPVRKVENGNKSDTYIVMAEHREDVVIVLKFEEVKKAYSEGKIDIKKSFVDKEWIEDRYVNVSHDKTTQMIINDKKKKIELVPKEIINLETDIFELDVQYIAHQCNCVTSHSAGFAQEVFERFPNSDIYKERPKKVKYNDLPKDRQLGIIVVRDKIINMLAQLYPGKPQYSNDTKEIRIEAFRSCLRKVGEIKGIKSIAFPYGIGCNMGGGKWETYYSAIEEFSKNNPKIQVYLVKKLK